MLLGGVRNGLRIWCWVQHHCVLANSDKQQHVTNSSADLGGCGVGHRMHEIPLFTMLYTVIKCKSHSFVKQACRNEKGMCLARL